MSDASRSGPSAWLVFGPGLAVAATGIGAGDVVAAAVAGARDDMAILWVERNRWWTNALLLVALLVFAYLLVHEVVG